MNKTYLNFRKCFLSLLAVLLVLFSLQAPVQAASGTVKLAKKTMKLQVMVDNGKTTRQTAKIKLNRAKSVKKMKVTYKSNRPKVAKVSSKGKVTAVGNGTATITVKVKYKHHLKHKWHIKVLKQKVIVKKTVKKKPAPKPPTTLKPTPNPKPDPEPNPKFHYIHNPEQNAKAMEDIIKNDNAIYGFSPNPTAGRLQEYAKYDWTDSAVVAGARQSRIEYHQSIASMYQMIEEMKAQEKSMEEIARAISAERNQIRIDSYKDDPEGLKSLKESNLRTYGQEEGPTPDQLYEKYGSWQTVLQKAFSVNMGMDACCGLYDDYYQLYIDLGLIREEGAAHSMGERNVFDWIYRICQDHKVLK